MASFIFNKDSNSYLDKESELVYNYYDNTINNTDIAIETSVSSIFGYLTMAGDNEKQSDTNILVNYYSQPNKPNLTYPDNNTKYNSRTIRFFSLIHDNILNLTCDSAGVPNNNIIGEMVIENTSSTGYQRIFTCFLLKSTDNNNTNTNLDILIKQPSVPDNEKNKSIKIQINDFIKDSSCITYSTDYGNIVIVFTTPIYINSNSANLLKGYSRNTSQFTKSPYDKLKYTIMNNLSHPKNDVVNSVSGVAKSLGEKKDDQIYIDCSPTGESSDKISTYNVPINSEYTENAQKIDFMKTTINICFSIIFLLIVYFLVPIIYKKIIIDNVNKYVEDNSRLFTEEMRKISENLDIPVNRFIRIQSIDFILSASIITIVAILIKEGWDEDKFYLIMTALYLSIIYGLGFSTIYLNKSSKDFMQTKVKNSKTKDIRIVGGVYPDELPNQQPINFIKITDIITFLGLSIMYIVSGARGYVFITMIFLFLLVLLILLILRYGLNIIHSLNDVFYWLGMITTFIIIPIVPITIMTNQDPPLT